MTKVQVFGQALSILCKELKRGMKAQSKAISEHILGIISDTHGKVRPEALSALADSHLIIHAGDIGKPEVIDQLRNIAPIVAVKGNVDRGDWTKSLSTTEVIELGGMIIYVLHNLVDLDLEPSSAKIDAVIHGHTHRPVIEDRNGVLFINPGSAGPRRFNLPVTLARLFVRKDGLEAQIVNLG